jgi:hypothetical protein
LVGNASDLLGILARYPGWLAFLRLKASSVHNFYRQARQLLVQSGFAHVQLSARGWPPPWNRSSGKDYGLLADVCDAVTPKLFTFDYSVLPRWYAQTLLEWNPTLTESEVLDALVECMDLEDDIRGRSLDDYHIPGPTEYHPADIDVYRGRVEQVIDHVAGRAPCYPISNPCMPETQWRKMVELVRHSRADGMWINMYGYLSPAKLETVRTTWA